MKILVMIWKMICDNILRYFYMFYFKGSTDPSHFMFEINVGKSLIRHRTTLKLNDEFLDRLQDDVIQIQSRCMSDQPLSDIDLKNEMTWVWNILNKG